MAFEIFCLVFFIEFLIFFSFVYPEKKKRYAEFRTFGREQISQQNQTVTTVHTKKQKRIFYLAYHHRSARVRKKNLKRLKGVIT